MRQEPSDGTTGVTPDQPNRSAEPGAAASARIRPATAHPLLVAILLWQCLAPAVAEELKDAGYGDGSLVNEAGDYFFPQADGTYLDAYGNYLTPGSAGQLLDPMGEVLDLAPDADAFTTTPWQGPTASDATDRAPAGDDTRTKPKTNPREDAQSRISEAVRQGIYMDVGTGYLDLDQPSDDLDPSLPGNTFDDPDAWSPPATTQWPARPYSSGSSEIPRGLLEPDTGPSIEDALDQRIIDGRHSDVDDMRGPFSERY